MEKSFWLRLIGNLFFFFALGFFLSGNWPVKAVSDLPCPEWDYRLYPAYPGGEILKTDQPNPLKDALQYVKEPEKYRIICRLSLSTDSSWEKVVAWYQNLWLKNGFEVCPGLSNDNPPELLAKHRTFSREENGFYRLARASLNEGVLSGKHHLAVEMDEVTKPFCDKQEPPPPIPPSFSANETSSRYSPPSFIPERIDNWYGKIIIRIFWEPIKNFWDFLKRFWH